MSKQDMKDYEKHMDELFTEWEFTGKPTIGKLPAIQNFLYDKKEARVIEMVDEYLEAGRGIAIFSVYLDPLFRLQKHYGNQASIIHGQMTAKERQVSIDDLASGKTKIALLSLGAGAFGIDGLQNKIDTALFLNLWFVPAIHRQGEGRLLNHKNRHLLR